MIICKLAEILGKKRLKIADVIEKTGITRPTLTNLYYNSGKGINFDTLDVLCKFLSIEPGELLAFYPNDFHVVIHVYKKDNHDILTKIFPHNQIVIAFYGLIAPERNEYDPVHYLGLINSDFEIVINFYIPTDDTGLRIVADQFLSEVVINGFLNEFKVKKTTRKKFKKIITVLNEVQRTRDYKTAKLTESDLQKLQEELSTVQNERLNK